GSVRDTLRLDVRVSEQVAGGVSMDTNVPAVTGSSTTTFTFSLTLHNDTAEDLTFALATQAPGEGWQVTAKPSAQAQAASVTVNAGSTSTISVDANPPDTVAAGKYPVSVTATAGDRTATADLLVEITGTYTMTLTTPDQRLNANGAAGSTIVRTLTVQNTGTADLVGVALTDSAPTGWTISFDTPKVDVPAGKSQDVNASIKPSNDAIAGDYVVTFTAATQDESIRSNVDIRVTVETSLVWAVVGIGLIVVTLGGLFWVFRRYGRR
ncbi:MAG TPA: NEW3 domain-containing protein, partial [Candidatus Limnocylindrales bacterium]